METGGGGDRYDDRGTSGGPSLNGDALPVDKALDGGSSSAPKEGSESSTPKEGSVVAFAIDLFIFNLINNKSATHDFNINIQPHCFHCSSI